MVISRGRASRYDAHYDAADVDGYALRSRVRAVLQLLGSGPGNVLDAGMGPGRLLDELDRRGWTIHGIDLSPEMVAIAQTRSPTARDRLLVGSVESLPFPDESFDAVTATGVLEYADVSKALREFSRILRPGGFCVVSYPNPYALYGLWKTRYYYRAVRSVKRIFGRELSFPTGSGPIQPSTFQEELGRAGLTPMKHEYTSFLVVPSPIDELLPRLAAALGQRVELHAIAPARIATQVVFSSRKDGDVPTDD
jgi:ubiquinone/menaquinone biosynthesis C-methylase UbiE